MANLVPVSRDEKVQREYCNTTICHWCHENPCGCGKRLYWDGEDWPAFWRKLRQERGHRSELVTN